MKILFTLILSFIVVALVDAQCDSMTLYTKDAGNGINQYAILFRWSISNDTIIAEGIDVPGKKKPVKLIFHIETGTCHWRDDVNEGTSLYRVSLINKETPRKGIINIRAKDQMGRIQLIYDGINEPRVFNIKF